jgi:hypothetical protein
MSVHIHTLRNCCARAFVLLPAPLLLGWALVPRSTNFELAQVSGQVTCANQPFSGELLFLPDHEGGPWALGLVKRDGSFQVYCNARADQQGAVPGTYRVVVHPRIRGLTRSRVDSKYQDPLTTDLLVTVAPDWNYVSFNLH